MLAPYRKACRALDDELTPVEAAQRSPDDQVIASDGVGMMLRMVAFVSVIAVAVIALLRHLPR